MKSKINQQPTASQYCLWYPHLSGIHYATKKSLFYDQKSTILSTCSLRSLIFCILKPRVYYILVTRFTRSIFYSTLPPPSWCFQPQFRWAEPTFCIFEENVR
ncbi:MAG: hypothetical protein ACKPKO_29345, partial [Candidatus Fonsibacter sp.]